MLLSDLTAAMELIPPGLSGIERQIWASVCIVSYHIEVSPDNVVSRDQLIGLLDLTDMLECQVMYYLSDGPERALVPEELMLIPEDTELPPNYVYHLISIQLR